MVFLRLPSQAIALANSEVTKATNDSSKKTWPIQEVSLKHRLNTSKLFWTPPWFTISTWSQLKVPSHYYSTLAFSYCMSICTKNFQHKKLTSENIVTWNILELWFCRTVAHYTSSSVYSNEEVWKCGIVYLNVCIPTPTGSMLKPWITDGLHIQDKLLEKVLLYNNTTGLSRQQGPMQGKLEWV